jgi:hypothetical protein
MSACRERCAGCNHRACVSCLKTCRFSLISMWRAMLSRRSSPHLFDGAPAVSRRLAIESAASGHPVAAIGTASRPRHDRAIDCSRCERFRIRLSGGHFCPRARALPKPDARAGGTFAVTMNARAPSDRHAFAKRSDRPKKNRELAAIFRIDGAGRRRSARAARTLELQLREEGDKRMRPHLHECRHVQSDQRLALVR